MKRRLLASLLALVMILGLLPVTALADNDAPTQEQTVYAVGEGINVTGLSGDVTISGYMDAKDWYVTDGLVLMYDGIYNAGMNDHADNPTNWTNLVDSTPALINSSATTNNEWTANGLQMMQS